MTSLDALGSSSGSGSPFTPQFNGEVPLKALPDEFTPEQALFNSCFNLDVTEQEFKKILSDCETIDYIDPKTGLTPLMAACLSDHDIDAICFYAKILLEHGADHSPIHPKSNLALIDHLMAQPFKDERTPLIEILKDAAEWATIP